MSSVFSEPGTVSAGAGPPARPRFVGPERHIVFMDELSRHSVREVCLGAAEYAAERPAWVFDPWPVGSSSRAVPTSSDLEMVNGVLTTEHACQRMRGVFRGVAAPVVFCLPDESPADADGVGIDEEAVGAMAAEHLWDRDYRQFAFVGSSAFGWSRGRGLGFERALAVRGKRPAVHPFTPTVVPVFWSWNLARRNRRLQEVLRGLPKPCGVFAANDVIACFLLQAARENRYRVPEDIGVVGVDNDPFPNAAAGLAISSIELPFREVGRQAARLLEERWQRRRSGQSLRLPPIRVVVRASTDAFTTQDRLVRAAQAYVEAHRHQRLTVAEVTRAVGSNRVTLGKRFQRELDVTLREYLRDRRLSFAAERLRQGDVNVEEVAYACGFSSPSYFSRLFTQVTGRRPGATRRARTG